MAALDVRPFGLPVSLLGSMCDESLVSLISAGSDDAFSELDARYRRRLVRYVHGIAGSAADAEDAVQDAMVRAVRALRAGSRPESVAGWLHRIARNCALDLAAARRRTPSSELEDHVHPPAEDAQSTLERSLHVRGLVADVRELPATQRDALILRELEGRSYIDIAQKLDVTVPAVKSLLVRARAGLRKAREAAIVAPFPGFLARFAERATTIVDPITSAVTPHVACVAVIAAASVPALVPSKPPPSQHRPAPVTATNAPARLGAVTTARAVDSPRSPEKAAGARDAKAAQDAAIRADCVDGVLDDAAPRTAILRALGNLDEQTEEYSDCRAALLSGAVASPHQLAP